MVELGRALARMTWGASLLGLQQLSPLGARPPAGRVLDALAEAAQGQLGDLLRSVFENGDQVGRDLIDRAGDLFSVTALLRGDPLEAASEMVAGGCEVGRAIFEGRSGRLALQELLHKLRVYWLVRGMEAEADPPECPDWPAEVAAAYGRDPYSTLFALERIGHRLVSAALAAPAPRDAECHPPGLLRGLEGRLPQQSLILVHAGMGMALAGHLVKPVHPAGATAVLDQALQRFLALCRESSVPGYAAAALEPLGLVVRTFAPRLMPRLDRRLRRSDPEAARFLWHGAGRALYFLPAHFFPCRGSFGRALALCRSEAPDEMVWRDCADGLFYAMTMVNLRSQAEGAEVLEMLVAEASGAVSDLAPLVSGLTAAVMVRDLTTPGDPAIGALLDHRPASGDLWRVDLWDRCVRRPCAAALERLRPAIVAGRRFAELARHRTALEIAA